MRGARWDVGVGSGKMPSDLGLVTVCVSVLVDDGGTLVVSPELDCSRYAPVVTPPCMSLSLAFAVPRRTLPLLAFARAAPHADAVINNTCRTHTPPTRWYDTSTLHVRSPCPLHPLTPCC